MIETWDGAPFSGAKLALLHGPYVATFLRDEVPGIAFPGCWDLPGGGREDDESPVACALRETREELSLALEPERIAWARRYPPWDGVSAPGWFLAAPLTRAEAAQVRLGDEGQRWELMPIRDFISHPGAISHLRARLADYLAAP